MQDAQLIKIKEYLDSPPDHRSLSRLIWRAGELHIKDAADKISRFAGSDQWQINYVTAWTLGRIGDASHLPVIEQLGKNKNIAVRRIAKEAYLRIAPDQDVQRLIHTTLSGLPSELAACIENNSAQELQSRVVEQLSHTGESNIKLLQDLYTLAVVYPCCHKALSGLLKTIPFSRKNYFKAFRHLLKISEFRLDSVIFGIIAARIETSPSGGWGAPFKPATKEYLRRRIWRTLRTLGRDKSNHYVPMAAAILLEFSDDNGKEPREVVRTAWNRETRKMEVVSRQFYDRFSGFLALNHILYQNSAQHILTKGGKSFCKVSDTADTGRVEAFPELWDARPKILIDLLLKSRLHMVHGFAVRALTDNPEYCRTIRTDIIAALLQSAYIETNAFSLRLAQERFNPEKPDKDLVLSCLLAAYTPARNQAVEWINTIPLLLKQSLELLVQTIISLHKDVRDRTGEFLDKADLDPAQRQSLVASVISSAAGMDDERLTQCAPKISRLLLDHFTGEVNRLELQAIEPLLKSDNQAAQLLGGRLLIHIDVAGQKISQEYFERFIQSSNEDLQGIGVGLLARFSNDYLLDNQGLLFSYCVSQAKPVRTAVRPIIQRLAEANHAFEEHLFGLLIPVLFKEEPSPGVHDDLILLIQEALANPFKKMDKNLRWRLIHAQSKGAQKLGAISLEDAGFDEYSVRQWAAFANTPMKTVRAWAMSAYREKPEKIRGAAAEALRILNSSWEDSRAFAIDYFRTTFGRDDWCPSIIIGICDNIQEDVRAFGTELVTQFFEQGDGVEYLTKLSQHPSRNVQLFISSYLSDYASDNIDRLRKLEPYFITVLSNVCKGRLAKDRVTMFLLEEALKSEPAAGLVARIFNRQSVTWSLTDRAAYIEGMCDIRDKFPDVGLDIQVKKLPIKGGRTESEQPWGFENAETQG